MQQERNPFVGLQHIRATDKEVMSYLYVQRPDGLTERLRHIITGKSRYRKVFLTGQNGSGKTTELRRLAQLVSDEFTVVFSGADELRTIEEPKKLDFLLFLLSALLKSLDGSQKKARKKIQSALERLTRFTSIEELEFKLSILGVTFKAKQPTNKFGESRQAIRKELGEYETEILSLVNTVLETLTISRDRPVLLLIDDIEKLEHIQYKLLIMNNMQLFKSLPCAAIITFPSELLFDAQLVTELRENFDDVGLSNIPLISRNGKHLRKNEKFLTQIIKLRMETITMRNFTDTECIQNLVKYSGGNIRQLLRLANSSIQNADFEKSPELKIEHVTEAVTKMTHDYRRFLTFDDRDLLHKIFLEKEFLRDMPMGLISNQSVLEYWEPRTLLWHDVNPIVLSLIL